ncbi:MAG: hypothetical protein EB121_00715 [Alphaproteobacteria bacterium]|nr:hypothetical protein [Alphaproteobacteria bacterium]
MSLPILWLGQEVLAATRGSGPSAWSAQRLVTQLENARPGDLWLRDKLSQGDWQQARQKNLAAVLTTEGQSHAITTPLVHVPSLASAQADLASVARLRSAASCVAIVGGCAEAVADILAGPQASRHIFRARALSDLPQMQLTMAQLPRQASMGLFPLLPSTRCHGTEAMQTIKPAMTIIAPGPLDAVPQLDKLVQQTLQTATLNTLVVLPADHPRFAMWLAEAQTSGVRHIFSYGQAQGADCQLNVTERQLQLSGFAGACMVPASSVNPWQATVLPVGWLAGHLLGIDRTMLQQRLLQPVADYTPLPVAKHGQLQLIDATMMATPTGFMNALQQLKNALCKGRKMVVLGDLGLLDPSALRFYTELAGPLAASGVARVFTCGFMTQALQQALPQPLRGEHCRHASQLLPALHHTLRDDDLLLVSGAKTMHLEELINGLPPCTINQAA